MAACAYIRRMTRTAVETVSEWFDSFARGDFAAARELFAVDGVVHVFADETAELHGFEEFAAWYGRRRQAVGESFEYRVDELLAGGSHAAALISLARTSAGRRIEWRQLAVYRAVEGQITEIRAYEEPKDGRGAWSPP